ncbi:MAG: adenylate/guanylate cyclase domain-containing protein, partial [Proteobacteria bacterium]|nr:adenylate/guanylate cyclase domain-containing protein [Pseudomonadota bacterium]
CLILLTKVTQIHKGKVIKEIGDELMCIFPTALDAVKAAKDMHQALEDMPPLDKPGFSHPNIYVGIQYGPVILEAGDVFGDAVNVAARMVALAKQRQIITTEETIEALPPGHDLDVRCIDKTTVKGKTGEMNIYEVIWEQQDLTVMVDDSVESDVIRARLELKFNDQVIVMDENKPSVTLGRQAHNDVVVNDTRVSRSHARIEYRRGKFIVIDQSSNGTFVLIQGKEGVTIKRDEKQLVGSGLIGLGRDVTPESPVAIHYAIKM